jgi:hypothetical protein
MTKALTASFEITEGDDWHLDARFHKNNVGVDLTGATITSSIRRGPANRFPDLLATPLCTIAPGTSGDFSVSLSRTQTKALGPGAYLGEISAEIDGRRVTRLCFKLLVAPEVDV